MGGTACQVEAQSVQFPLCSKIDDSILGFSANSFHFPPPGRLKQKTCILLGERGYSVSNFYC